MVNFRRTEKKVLFCLIPLCSKSFFLKYEVCCRYLILSATAEYYG